MAITSGNNSHSFIQFKSIHFRYAVTYVFITGFVLLFLNIYSAKVSQTIFYNSKRSSMMDKCHLVATELSDLDVINPRTVSKTIAGLGPSKVSRLIVTDRGGKAVYDSISEFNSEDYILFPEIIQSLQGYNGYDVIRCSYQDGTMTSRAATPIVSYGTLIGSVYIMEYDTQQGMLIQSLQKNTLYITIFLELIVIIFSLIFSSAFTKRLRKIMASMRIIHEGDYSHKVSMGGNDELTVLGNEFNNLIERLQTSEQKRSHFVSDASHELKTPLASIKLLSDSILQNDMDMDTIRDFVGDIGKEADRLNRMSQKLLSLSRIESQQDSDCEIIFFAPTVQRVVKMLSEIARANQIKIQTDLEQDCSILILEDDLYQIIFNLVENGIKYNTVGGTLTVSVRRQEDNALLTVQDTGVGIPPESLEHIFERFYRVDKARSRKSGGSGLGLSIVRNMVERNGGHISVHSTVGQGTAFTVSFPVFDTEDSV